MTGNIHRRLLTIAGPVWRQVGLTLAVSLAMSAALLAQAFLVGMILIRLYEGRPLADVSGLLIAVVALVAIRAGLAWLREVCVQLTAAAVKDRIRTRMLDRLVDLGPGYVLRVRTGQVQSTTVDGVEALEAYFGTLVIAHRLSTVRRADRIVVLSRGTVAEIGAHTELVDRRGDYARLIAAQGDSR